MPALDDLDGLLYRLFRILAQLGRNFITFVHHAFADDGAEPTLLDNPQHLFGVPDGLHRQRAGRAALNQFGNP